MEKVNEMNEMIDKQLNGGKQMENKMSMNDQISLVIHAIYFARNNARMFLDTNVMKETLYTDVDLNNFVKDIERQNIFVSITVNTR